MVGKNIKSYLKENGIKQNFVAQKIGIPATTLNSMLKNRNYPLIRISEFATYWESHRRDLHRSQDKDKQAEDQIEQGDEKDGKVLCK